MRLKDTELQLLNPKYSLESHFPTKDRGIWTCMQELLSLSQYNTRVEHSIVYPEDSSNKPLLHCSGHCLPDPPFTPLWSRVEKHEIKARKFTYLDATWWDCSGHVFSGSSNPHTSSQLSEMPGGDAIAGHEGRRSIFLGCYTQITNALSQHPAVTWTRSSTTHQWIIQLCVVPKPRCCQLFAVTCLSKYRETSRKVNWCRGI